jgi:rhodanese-related sulfurtransferase
MSSQPLQKKKFAHIRGTLDTGMNVLKAKVPTNSEFIRRRTEIYFRITRGQLESLYSEYEQYESIRETVNQSSPQGPKIVSHEDSAEVIDERPYLILDGREAAEYRVNHLVNSFSFPYQHLRRDIVPPNFNSFRNRHGALIIVYCADERVSRDMAKMLVDRGTENIFVLTGGFNEFAAAFPSYVEGELPKGAAAPMPITKNTRLTKSALSRIDEQHNETAAETRRKFRESAGGASVMSSARGSPSRRMLPGASSGTLTRPRLNRSSRNGSENMSDGGMSARSTMSVADSIISRASARKGTGKFYG